MNHDLTTHAGQISHYAAVRARIAAAAYKPPNPRKTTITSDWTRRPMWMSDDIEFDYHVLLYRIEKACAPHIKWLKRRCIELMLDYDDIIGDRRYRELIKPRFRLIWEMKQKFPELSLPQIGRAFGGKDHTSILNAIRRWEVMRHEND